MEEGGTFQEGSERVDISSNESVKILASPTRTYATEKEYCSTPNQHRTQPFLRHLYQLFSSKSAYRYQPKCHNYYKKEIVVPRLQLRNKSTKCRRTSCIN